MKIFRFAAPVMAVALCVGCGEDPELVRKSEQQKAEIRRLERELGLLQEKIARAPKDRSAELVEVRAEIGREEERIAELETGVRELEVRRKEIEKEFEEYKREYPIR